MQYIDEYRDSGRIKALAEAIEREALHPWQIMEICGGQTHTIAKYRLEEMLPPSVRLLHGPGCPVCVTPSSIIDFALEIARQSNVIFTSFGDMLRVPGSKADLLQTKARGADIRILYSPLDAVNLAAGNPDREVVFFAVGFETTAPVHLTALKEAERRGLKNFSLLCSLFAVPPAIEMLMNQEDNAIDGFLAAGHVCAVTGNSDYRVLTKKYHCPIVVTGFEPADLLYGIYLCIKQLESGRSELENAYKRAVPENGNPAARRLMDECLEAAGREWRGIGAIPESGFILRKKYAGFDASEKFGFLKNKKNLIIENADNQCIAGKIMKGAAAVSDCPFFGGLCSPEHPVGAPMVSDEGVCAAFFKYR
ncbi:MAG: hydrogenase formation protein HypD [Dysgonamonadaceae bacterium]|jgi:hydrogenase expression/formation protein HypD|nr:hydrogenase formation protein HypD [Dysgonamonadaceae bacterium]